MKIILILILLIFNTIASAADYYISSSGNDTNNGLSTSTPWKTMTKVNSTFSIMKPGDNILFNRGDTFYGSLTITKSGASGSPITIGAYGAGEKPIITGFTTITGWTNEGGGIYSKVIAAESSTNNIVTVNGVNTAMGRWPNTGYMSYETHSGNVSITDNQVTGTPNWTGAELVLRRTQWTLNRNLITNHTNTTITYVPAVGSWDGPTDGFGYFIQNDIKTLDDIGDWYYNGTTLYMYFGGNNPIDYTVRISTLKELITTGIDYTTHSNYVTLENITFEGSNLAAVYLGQYSRYWTIQNCDFNFNGKDGIYAVQTSFLTVNNNTFNQINNNAIRTTWLGDNTIISNNKVTNIGILPGMGGIDDGSYDAIVLQARTISLSNGIVEYNTIQNVGHIGLRMIGSGYTIHHNLITNYGLIKGDAGAIYTYHVDTVLISNNIILNSNHILDGIGIGIDHIPQLNGIYLDNNSCNIKIAGNTVHNVIYYGIFVQGSQNVEVSDNIVYACSRSQLAVTTRLDTSFISGINVHNNVFFAKTAGLTSYPYSPLTALFSTSLGDINTWGVFDNNYYTRPIDDDDVIRRYDYVLPDPWNGKGLTLTQWQSYSGYDVNSHKSPIAVTDTADIHFYYNETKVNKVIALARPMIDVKGTKYANNITLLPFRSAVLMVDPNPILPVIPVYVSAVIQNAAPAVLEMTYNLSLSKILPAASAFSVRVNSVAVTVNSVAVSGTKVLLTLAVPVVYGDVVTVAYTKPSTNPLQTTSVGQAASLSAQAVINNVAPPSPVYVSSAIQNAAPSVLEMTYNLNLANIAPAASSFSVQVNSVTWTVNTVAVSGTKVQLTLAVPVVYGDVVTVAYTQPSVNPLQTTSAGLAASISAQPVTNNVAPPSPVYVSSAIENAAPAVLEMTYNLNLANIAPAASSFSVQVNSVTWTVNTVAVSGTKVQLTLAVPVVYGDVVTVAYTQPSVNPLQTTSAGLAASISAQPVTNNVAPPNPVYVSSAIQNAAPAVLEMTYNLGLSNLTPAASAFSVLVNSVAVTVNTVAVSGTKVLLTLAVPVVYGDVVTVAYTKPSTSPLQTTSAGQAASVSAQAVTNNVAPPSPVYVSAAIQNAAPAVVEMSYNLSLANIAPVASAFSVQVNSVNRTVNTVAVSGTKVLLTLAVPVVYGDVVTVAYTQPSANPLQTVSTGQAASISAQAVTNNVNPTSPVYVSSAIENDTPSVLEMTYNLSLANITPAASAFSVQVNSVVRTVNSVAVSGTKVLLTLAVPVVYGDVVTVLYTKPSANPLQTSSAGQAASVSAQPVTNNVAPPSPEYVSSAIQNATPSLLEMIYNRSLANIVPVASAFSVQVNSVIRSVNTVAVSGTKVLLTLTGPVVYGDVVTVSYTKPSANPLQTASAGLAESVRAQAVTNNCLKIPAKNDPPVIVIKNDTSSYSGSVGEIDASGSYDLNNDSLTYGWIVPDHISASSTNSPIIQFLSPVVKTAQNFEFQLKVGDGKAVVTRSITFTISPYKSSEDGVVNCTLMIPNAFSPNGDGINDYFKVSCIENYPDAKLLIYSRTSALLYEKQHYGNLDFWGSEDEACWAGHIGNSGNTLASGSYIYILDLDHGKKDLIKTGVVFISS